MARAIESGCGMVLEVKALKCPVCGLEFSGACDVESLQRHVGAVHGLRGAAAWRKVYFAIEKAGRAFVNVWED
jgi:hypothetical protein